MKENRTAWPWAGELRHDLTSKTIESSEEFPGIVMIDDNGERWLIVLPTDHGMFDHAEKVRLAVKCHDDLLKALEGLMDQPTENPIRLTPEQRREMWKAHDAARSALAAAKGSDWQPIKTAPKNEYVLVYCPDAEESTQIMICGFLVCDDPADTPDWYELNCSRSGPLDVEPTHWMPLPASPVRAPSESRP